MLVLSRKANQTITIGQNIEVRIIQIQGGRVKIGVDAPDSVRILRGELQSFDEEFESEPEEETAKFLGQMMSSDPHQESVETPLGI